MQGRNPHSDWPPNWDAAKSDIDRLEISESLLHLVQELYASFPDHCKPSTGQRFAENQQDYEQFFSWTKAQGIVVGEIDKCALTLSGRQAFRAALRDLPDFATRLMATDAKLSQHEAATLWLSTLRNHFDLLGRPL